MAKRRNQIHMTDAERECFIEERKSLQVATLNKDGSPHLTTLWFAVVDGDIVFETFTKSQKIVNLRRDPKLTVLAEEGTAYAELKGVMIKGEAELIDDPTVVLELYGELAARYPMVGDDPVALDRDALEAAFGRFAAKNTGVIVHPIKVVSWDHTKLAGAY